MKKVLTLFTVLLIKSSLCAAVWPAVASGLGNFDTAGGAVSETITGVATNSFVQIDAVAGDTWSVESLPIPMNELSVFIGATQPTPGSMPSSTSTTGITSFSTPGTYWILITFFGPPIQTFIINGTATTTPVILSDFYLRASHGNVELFWETASEINSSHFEIETSLDGRKFFKIGEVDAAGKAAKYSYLDKNVLDGLYYYRLKQVDNDGTFEYSGIRNVHLEESGNTIVYPVPTTSLLFVKGNVSGNISLYTMQGARLYVPIEYNDNETKISLDHLPKGFYLLKIGDTKVKKIMKI